LFHEAGNRQREAVAANLTGQFYSSMSEYQIALTYYNQALEIARSLNDRREIATAHGNLGSLYQSTGDYQNALNSYQQSLELKRAIGDRLGVAAMLSDIGAVLEKMGDVQKSLEHHTEALLSQRAAGNRSGEARTLYNIATVYEHAGDKDRAVEYYMQTLKLKRELEERDGEAETMFGVARIELARGNPDVASDQIEKALGIIESLRIKVAGQELRSSYLASRRSYYEFYIDLLMRQHWQHPSGKRDLIALEVCERARARSLLELLGEARVDIRQGVDIALLDRERGLQQRLNAKEQYRLRLLGARNNLLQLRKRLRH
jgi:tetratricopeptide (TPR) repeat protein